MGHDVHQQEIANYLVQTGCRWREVISHLKCLWWFHEPSQVGDSYRLINSDCKSPFHLIKLNEVFYGPAIALTGDELQDGNGPVTALTGDELRDGNGPVTALTGDELIESHE